MGSRAQQARDAARAMTALDDFWWENLIRSAILPAWAATRAELPRELWNTTVSDHIAEASVKAVQERLAQWAAESDDED